MKPEVLYTHDMEPITILPMSPAMERYLDTQGFVRVAVMRGRDLASWERTIPVSGLYRPMEVLITQEWFQRRNLRHRFLFTDNEEAALLLRPDFLPGQRSEVQRIQREQFARGFLHAIQVMG